MEAVKTDVDYWSQIQFMQGGPSHCSQYIRQQVRMAKARYKRQYRHLRREVVKGTAERTTISNCHKILFPKPKSPQPAMIEGHSRLSQPQMWRNHFKTVLKANDQPGDNTTLLKPINDIISETDIKHFEYFHIDELNYSISNINTSKSFKRHHHWKSLKDKCHPAKICLLHVFNSISNDMLKDNYNLNYNLFHTDLSPIPKKGKKDFSSIKSWRPISIGTSECWILEKNISKTPHTFSQHL